MRPDLADLQAFYGSRSGQLARRLVYTQLRQLWPDLRGRSVLGLGYAIPLLAAFDEAERVVALVPGGAATAWPTDAPNRVAVVNEGELPLPDASIDRVLLAHALETSPALKRLMREVWRVLADGGRLIALVPNRRGLWCWSVRTPFGHGQPFSLGQVETTLRRHLFEPVGSRNALYLPPTGSGLLLRFAIPCERLGLRLAPQLSGVLLVEAEKQVFLPAAVPAPAKRAKRRVYAVAPQSVMAARVDADDG
jgi:SAM-dependent methyltransferase